MIDRYNYTWIQQFLQYFLDVKGLKEVSVRRYKHHLNHLLNWAEDEQLCNVQEKRPTFLSYVRKLTNKDGTSLDLETQSRIMETAKRFFTWAKLHIPTEFRMVQPHWIDTIQMPKSNHQKKKNIFISLEEILQIARLKIDSQDLVLQRDQAAAVMLFLSGMRAGAFTTAPIRAFNLKKREVYQSSEYGVKTKNGKSATTFLLPIDELLLVVNQWDKLVRSKLPDTDPWYAPIKNKWGEHEFSREPIGKNRAATLNKRLVNLFKAAGLPYKSAHKFRHGFAVYGRKQAKDMDGYKAISHSLMHNDISITDSIYAPMHDDEAGAQIAKMTPANTQAPEASLADSLEGLSKKDLAALLDTASRRLKDE